MQVSDSERGAFLTPTAGCFPSRQREKTPSAPNDAQQNLGTNDAADVQLAALGREVVSAFALPRRPSSGKGGEQSSDLGAVLGIPAMRARNIDDAHRSGTDWPPES